MIETQEARKIINKTKEELSGKLPAAYAAGFRLFQAVLALNPLYPAVVCTF